MFAALTHPTRRDVLDLLLGGPLPAGEIAERFDMARPSGSEHLEVLLDAGLSPSPGAADNVTTPSPEPLRDHAVG